MSAVNLLHIFRTPFPENTSRGLLLLTGSKMITCAIAPTVLLIFAFIFQILLSTKCLSKEIQQFKCQS